MEIIKLRTAIRKERRNRRSKNLKKNKSAYSKLKKMFVPEVMNLSTFRKYYKPVLSLEQKDVLSKKGLDPWSLEGLKYVGDCKMNDLKLGDDLSVDKIVLIERNDD